MNRDAFWGFVLGVIACIWMSAAPWSDTTKYRDAIKECEKSLPRDKHCKVVGVPEL